MSRLWRIVEFENFSHPAFLGLGVVAALVLAVELLGPSPGALTVSTGETLFKLRIRHADLARRLPALLRFLGLLLLLVALAGPLRGYHVRKDRANVIDIMLCLDVSGSMQQPDFVLGGRQYDRMHVAREAARKFVNSRREAGNSRYGLDRIGLILFAGLAWTQCPLTLDYDILEHEIEQVGIAPDRKQGTAIGSALGLAVRRLSESEAKSKVVVLLTDGVNNRGELDPVTAARLAKEYGIRVYTIGAGSAEETVIQRGFFPMRTEAIDEAQLQQIASITGGRYYLAGDTDALMNAYDEISALERTEIDIADYYEANVEFMFYLVAGALALLASVFSRRIWFEIIP